MVRAHTYGGGRAPVRAVRRRHAGVPRNRHRQTRLGADMSTSWAAAEPGYTNRRCGWRPLIVMPAGRRRLWWHEQEHGQPYLEVAER